MQHQGLASHLKTVLVGLGDDFKAPHVLLFGVGYLAVIRGARLAFGCGDPAFVNQLAKVGLDYSVGGPP